jgi:hypothetical protein
LMRLTLSDGLSLLKGTERISNSRVKIQAW